MADEDVWERFQVRKDAERVAVKAHARWLACVRDEQVAKRVLQAAVADWHGAGVSQRGIGHRLGLSHPTVAGMIERSAESPPSQEPLERRPVPVVFPGELDDYLPAFGELASIWLAFEEADILIELGRHPVAFAYGSSVEIPRMVLVNSAGEALGVDDCVPGYGGTGPHNAFDVLLKLGLAETEARAVFQHRFLHYDLVNGNHRLELAPRHDLYVRGLRLIDGFPVVVVEDEEGVAHNWISHVLDREPRLSWADGERVARVYLDYEAAALAGLRALTPLDHRIRTLIIEQGELQLWIPAYLPREWTQFVSDEAAEILETAGLSPEISARTWVQKILAHTSRRHALFADISRDGQGHLARDPQPLPSKLED